MAWIGAFAALTAVSAHIQIPHLPVPYTMQTFAVLAAGGVLGMRNGALSQIAYLVAGAVGVPVFAHIPDGTTAFMSFFGPTGGYLLAFPVAAGLVGFVSERFESRWLLAASMILATVVIFLIGTIQLNMVVFHNWDLAFAQGFMIFSWWDAAKIIGALSVALALRPPTAHAN